MNKKIYVLLVAQFLSAFADNAILFTVIALVMQSTTLAHWYVPALQSMFLISFIIFAPWVGTWADIFPKKYILFIASIIKAIGGSLLFINTEPLIAYAIVGLGAALYSPAKYGILPELTHHNTLVTTNSWVESTTILAILLGMLSGAYIADHSISHALIISISLFVVSALISLLLPKTTPKRTTLHYKHLRTFLKHTNILLINSKSRFAILGGALFWLAAATLRVILIAWAPLVLLTKSSSDIAQLTLFLAIGIIIGSSIAPKIIPLNKIRRTRIPALLMAIFIMQLGLIDTLWGTRITLLLIGSAGGLFIVPINSLLQDIGQHSIGSGTAVALQNFFQNIAMLIGVSSYTYASAINISPSTALLSLGFFILSGVLIISFSLPKNNHY